MSCLGSTGCEHCLFCCKVFAVSSPCKRSDHLSFGRCCQVGGLDMRPLAAPWVRWRVFECSVKDTCQRSCGFAQARRLQPNYDTAIHTMKNIVLPGNRFLMVFFRFFSWIGVWGGGGGVGFSIVFSLRLVVSSGIHLQHVGPCLQPPHGAVTLKCCLSEPSAEDICHSVAAMGFTVVRLPFSSEMLRVQSVPEGGPEEIGAFGGHVLFTRSSEFNPIPMKCKTSLRQIAS